MDSAVRIAQMLAKNITIVKGYFLNIRIWTDITGCYIWTGEEMIK